ncbi:GIN domain-containing protein [Brevundimonas sp. UBA7664]|uniref:GIN domain-containing protein n=1 Tax=Brevundimonas sp. UBA7664 TaxID=1946141 RepID=UPI0025B96206|nr:DUF2807 domain-containing protein [Brevundimonas sp. UBA7664]
MKPVIASAIVIAAAAMAAPAFAKEPDVEIRHAVARVAVVVEDRTDIAVEIEQGTSGLPAPRVTRDGANVRIDGGLGRRGFMNRGDGIRNCNTGSGNPATPGDGATVEVRNVGRVSISDAPLIVIRTPRAVNVNASGAVFGSVGRGATSIDLGNGGCGYWNVANADGPVSLSIGGSGDMRAGTSTALDISIGGSGSVTAGATGELEVAIGGSGDVVVARVDGRTDVSIGGSGDVDIRAGTAPDLSISIAGSGDVNFGGVAGDVDVSLVGGGDVTVARATGSVSRSIMGGGDVRIGS